MDKSIKDSERQRWEKKTPIEVHDVWREMLTPQEMDQILAIIDLMGFSSSVLALRVLDRLVHVWKDVSELNVTMEEADARIIPHVVHERTCLGSCPQFTF